MIKSRCKNSYKDEPFTKLKNYTLYVAPGSAQYYVHDDDQVRHQVSLRDGKGLIKGHRSVLEVVQ